MSTTEGGVIVNAWEIQGDEQAVMALAGPSSFDEIRADRQNRAREMSQILSITTAKAGFEIGSGNGVVANCLASRCARLDCNDISASFLDLARKECADSPNVRFFQIENYLGHLPSNNYDFGYSLNVFIHFNLFDIYHYLTDVERLLKPSGLFFFDACTVGDQTIDKFREHAGFYRNDPANVRGLLCFNDPQVVGRIVKETGLQVVRRDGAKREGWMKVLVRKPA